MAGQVWLENTLGGYMFAPNLSKVLRHVVRSRCKFRQFTSLPENQGVALHKGQTFSWNIYTDAETEGGVLPEGQDMPETNFKVTQKSVQVKQFGNSVPFTELLDNLSEHPVKQIATTVMKVDASNVLDKRAAGEFAKSGLIVEAAGGNSATNIEINETGAAQNQNDIELNKTHVRLIATQMAERDIPTLDHGDYEAIGRPNSFVTFKTEMESVQQYTTEGYGTIRNGEVGRFEGVRFTAQTNVPNAGWANAKSDSVYFFGDDSVAECCAIPEEIRGKLPGNYGLDKGVAWFYLGEFGICRGNVTTGAEADVKDARIMIWSSNG